jgi:hypothetical protein
MRRAVNFITGRDWRPPPRPTEPHEIRLAAFLEIVDCDPAAVIDTFELCGHWAVPAEDFQPAPGGDVMFFGRYKGQRIADVPDHYLRWALGVQNPNRSMRRFQKDAAAELQRRSPPARSDCPF